MKLDLASLDGSFFFPSQLVGNLGKQPLENRLSTDALASQPAPDSGSCPTILTSSRRGLGSDSGKAGKSNPQRKHVGKQN